MFRCLKITYYSRMFLKLLKVHIKTTFLFIKVVEFQFFYSKRDSSTAVLKTKSGECFCC